MKPVPILRLVLLVGPIVAILALLRLFVEPASKAAYDRELPPGYERLGKEGSYVVYGKKQKDGPDALKLAAALDRFIARFIRTYGDKFGLGAFDSEGVRLYFFERKQDLDRFARGWKNIDLTRNGGVYEPTSRVIALFGSSSDPGPLFHEGIHLLFDVAMPELNRSEFAPWLSEGLATYFEGSREGGPGGTLLGDLPPLLREEGKKNPQGLSEIMSVPQEKFSEPDNLRWYAAAGLLVEFLMKGDQGEHREKFFEFCRTKSGAGAGPRELAAGLGVSPEDLEKRYADFARRGGR